MSLITKTKNFLVSLVSGTKKLLEPKPFDIEEFFSRQDVIDYVADKFADYVLKREGDSNVYTDSLDLRTVKGDIIKTNISSRFDEQVSEVLGTSTKSGDGVIHRKIKDSKIELLTKLCLTDGYMSRAYYNMILLGNTSFSININGKGAKELEKIKDLLNKFNDDVNGYGIQTVINSLLSQVAMTGALSYECGYDDKFTKTKIFLVDPFSIYFKKQGNELIPLQKLKHTNHLTNNLLSGQYIQLNTETYKYIPFYTIDRNPYAIPPFVSALDDVEIKDTLKKHIISVVKRLGLLGFVSALLPEPVKKPGKDDETHKLNVNRALTQAVNEISQGLGNGVLVGFKGKHDFSFHDSTSSGASGAKDLFEMMVSGLIVGLKQDPMLFGMSGNSSETLGRITLALSSSQLKSYQELVAKAVSDLYKFYLRSEGILVDNLVIKFSSPAIADELRIAQSRQIEVNTLLALAANGNVDNEYVNHILNLPLPVSKVPLSTQPPETSKPRGEKVNDTTTNPRTKNKPDNRKQLNSETKNFLACSCGDKDCDHSDEFLDFSDKTANTIYKQYLKKTKDNFNLYLKTLKNTLTDKFDGVEDMSFTEFSNTIMDTVNSLMTGYMSRQLVNDKAYCKDIYKMYRINGNLTFTDAPMGTYGVIDDTVVSMFANNNNFYFGQLVNDPQTQAAMMDYIINTYIVDGNNNFADVDMTAFLQQFPQFVGQDAWKIQRFINTSVSRMRMAGSVMLMNEVGVEKYIYDAVNDSTTCKWCSQLDGKEFTVSSGVQAVNNFASSGSASTFPIINTLIPDPQSLVNMSGTALQGLGFSLPPSHPNCRCVIIPVI